MNLNKHIDPQRLLDVTQRFQQELRRGQRPSIGSHLSAVSDGEKPALFRELLSVELGNLRAAGKQPCRESYLHQFPEFASIIQEQFAGLRSFVTSMNSTTSQDSRSDSGAVEFLPPEPLRPQLQRYRLLERLGQGGFGDVWRAYDEQSQRYVAIKGPRSDRAITPKRVAKFLAEARRIREVDVEGVVKVLDIIHCDGPTLNVSMCFIVLELMEGGSLADRLTNASRRQAIGWVARVADTLAELHRHAIVHRDIKPENILFDKRDRPYLSDFGLAATEAEQLAERPGMLGTVAYMSPEQARGTHVDRRADIYSLGVVLYRILANDRFPYLANNRQEFLDQLLDEHVAPRALPDTIPVRLARACERCIHKDVSQRYRTAQQLGRELWSWHNRIRNRIAIAVAGGALAAGIAAVAYSLPTANDGPQLSDQQPLAAAISSPSNQPPITAQPDPSAALVMLPVAAVKETSIGSNLRLAVDQIVWPYNDTTQWSLADGGNALHVSSSHVSLLAVGQLRAEQDLVLDVDISQLQWTGRVGVFMGHRVGPDGRTRFELLELRNYDGHFECLRSIRQYRHTPEGIGEYQLTRSPIPPPQGPQTLSLWIREGKLSDVRCNGESLSRLMDVPLGSRNRVEDCRGEIGFFNENSAAEFSRLQIDHSLVRMQKQLSPNSL